MTWPRAVMALTVVVAGVYVLMRAARVSITYDEAATWLRYGDAPWLALFDFEVATNHFLNTALTRFAAALAGPSEFVLRLPNLAGYALYAYATWQLTRRISSGVVAAAAFVLLHLNPYLLDYFALSRGYGLSQGLLAAATWWWWLAIEARRAGNSATSRVTTFCLFGGAATLANFSVLTPVLALSSVLLVVAMIYRRTSVTPADTPSRPPRRVWVRRAAWTSGAIVFIALVWSQDARLATASMYQPILVRVAGLENSERAGIRVLRRDLRGRLLPVGRNDRGEWPIVPPVAVTGLRVELPAAVADAAAVEVLTGDREFFDSPSTARRWQRRDIDGTVVLDSTPALSMERSRLPTYRDVINWTSDAAHWRAVAVATGGSLVTLAMLLVVLRGIAWLLARARLLAPDIASPLATGIAGIAAVAGVPLSILSRNHELYYGRLDGLVENTFSSLIQSSLYRQQYFADQEIWAWRIVVGAAVLGVAACVVVFWRLRSEQAFAGLSLAGVITLTSIAAVTVHAWRGTPFPFGRTALSFLPLAGLFIAFAIDAAAALTRSIRIAVVLAMSVTALAAGIHFRRAANLQSTYDWPLDASTRTMMADLRRIAVPAPGTDTALLGVDWVCYAGAAYYARRYPTPPIRVLTLPANDPVQYIYVEPGSTPGVTLDPLMILRRYAAAGMVLAKAAQ